MWRAFFCLAVATLAIAGAEEPVPVGPAPEPVYPIKTEAEKAGYAMGINIGIGLDTVRDEIDVNAVIAGIRETLAGKAQMTPSDMRNTLQSFQQIARLKQATAATKYLDKNKNKKEGEEFLEANKKVPGVVTLPSGLQYLVLREGNGDTPKSDDKVEVYYKGSLVNGVVFDRSREFGEPAVLALNDEELVLKGWREALQLMKKGAKWRLFLPSNLAFGERVGPIKVGPNSALVYDMELVAIQKKPGDNK